MKRPLAAFALGLFLFGSASFAQEPKPNPYLSQARVSFQGADYKKCLKRLAQASGRASTPEEVVEIDLYNGLCNFEMKRKDKAESHFRLALSKNVQAQLPSYVSPEVQKFFGRIQEELAPPLPPPPPPPIAVVADEPPPPLTPKREATKVLLPQPAPLAVTATEPEVKGKSFAAPIVLGILAAVAGGTAAYFGNDAQTKAAQANGARLDTEFRSLGEQANQSALLANVGFGVAGAAAAGALISIAVINSGE